MTPSRFEFSAQDAVSWLRTLPSESIDLLITDDGISSEVAQAFAANGVKVLTA